jgi:GWxTD domain-containing protein
MTVLESWAQTPAVTALGWTLIHFLWEGAAIALVLAAALGMARSSRARYAAACLAILAMPAGFGLTFARLMPPQGIAGTAAIRAPGVPREADELWAGARTPSQRFAEDFLPWLVPFWIAGAAAFELRTLAGWIAAQRLRSRGEYPAPEFWQRRIIRLGMNLSLSRQVTLLESCLADVPVVIGYLRPVILMPAGLLMGLPAGQIESLLLHELAHIRRYDYLVNLLQTSVEGLLFYHPAMWWVSGVIRAERENCCDDVVVATSGNAHGYAVALATLEQRRCATQEAAMAATGGSLVKRIRRLLDQPEGPRGALRPVFSAGLLTITAATFLAAWQSKPAGDSGNRTAPALVAQAQPAPTRRLDISSADRWLKWLKEDVVYIISNDERAAFNRLKTDPEREHFIEQFWQRRDPTPGTPENEFKDEHYRRITVANNRFGHADIPGWKTDRGRIFIKWGPPDEIEDHRADMTYPLQQWKYRHMEGIGNNVIVDFEDKSKSGDFRMTTDPHGKDAGRRITP